MSDRASPPRTRRYSPVAAAIAASAAVAAFLTLTPEALADEETTASRRAAAAREKDRPYMMAELGAAILSLPAAEVCITLDSCEDGETSVGVGIQNIYRYRSIGFGAGIRWATTLRSDAAEGAEELERDHSRRYFFVEGQFRYYAIRQASWEWWVGGTIGGVVVSDSWSVKAYREPYTDTDYVGPRAVTIGTEGLATGLALGTEWAFAANWSLGVQARYSIWVLPGEREESPTGDSASLSGRVDMIDLNLVIAYRIAM
jgi:hypothetical protein